MSLLEDRIQDLQRRLARALETIHFSEQIVRLAGLERTMEAPDFWSRPDVARDVSQQVSDLRKDITAWQELSRDISELSDFLSLAQESDDQNMVDQVTDACTRAEERFATMEFRVLFSGEFDDRPAIVSLHAGAGGTDANDWVAMLLRMYTRFAEVQGWSVEVLDESPAEIAGYKSITFAVRGRFAYGYLQSEHGVHRLVRISPFDAEKMRHTTFALCEVVPEFAEVDAAAIVLNPDDLRVDTFMSSGKGGQSVNTTYSAVRITHIPTGIAVACQNERSQSQNKDIALRLLKARLYRLMVEARAERIADVKGEHKTAAWGNQIRSYVLHPYKMVKDHRTDVETPHAETVLDGELLPFIEAYLRLRKKGE